MFVLALDDRSISSKLFQLHCKLTLLYKEHIKTRKAFEPKILVRLLYNIMLLITYTQTNNFV